MDEDIILESSFHDYKVIQAQVADLNKKRELENEQPCFPLSKHNLGYQRSGCEHEQTLAEESEENEMRKRKGKRIADNSAELESAKDSDGLEPKYTLQTCTYAQDSTSSGSCSSIKIRAYPVQEAPATAGSGEGQMYAVLPPLRKDAVSSYSSIKEPNNVDKEDQEIVTGVAESNHPNEMGPLQHGEGAQLSVDKLKQSEYCLDEELEEMLLYSNGLPETDLFVLSSERSSINQEAQQGPKGPTIDKEFEEYFSTFLL